MRLVEEDEAIVANEASMDRGDALAPAIAAEKQTRAELIDRTAYNGGLRRESRTIVIAQDAAAQPGCGQWAFCST